MAEYVVIIYLLQLVACITLVQDLPNFPFLYSVAWLRSVVVSKKQSTCTILLNIGIRRLRDACSHARALLNIFCLETVARGGLFTSVQSYVWSIPFMFQMCL